MSKQILQMKYHPAKKDVEFHRFQSGKEIKIPKDSRLCNYMSKRGKFVLQDHGNIFLEDIAKTFDGERIVTIEVITTQNDFEDFMQMIEFYNDSEPDIKINATLLSELPDMEQTYQIVKRHGESSVGVLEQHKSKIFDVRMDNADVKKCVEDFSADIQKQIDSIQEKIEATAENKVSLCFTGVYSAGKSALINAILGYAILPESIKSETAKMFCIQSPKENEKVRVIFNIRATYTELLWNDTSNVFEFLAGPTESVTRSSIQETINQYRTEHQHIQINKIFKTLNDDENVSSDIKVFFPIPIDNKQVQFTIYDTPGTDSNYGEHQTILKDALSEQTHSILIFVAAPDKVEGEGNNALLNYIKEAEKKDSKTSIDIGRSLFVINKADSTKNPDALRALQTAEIRDKEDSDFSIKLVDKKVFFISAMFAYAGKAVKNKIPTEDDTYLVDEDSGKLKNEKRGRYYQFNRCATSEYATNKLIAASENALEKAEEAKDKLEVLHICSGLYALENEIVVYGEKFASAVKAYAIIDSVDKALSKLNTNAMSLERQNQQDIYEINKAIEDLRSAITGSINQIYDCHAISSDTPLPQNILTALRLDSKTLQTNLIGNPKSSIKKLLQGRFWGLGKVRYNEKHKREIQQKIASVLDDFSRNFLEKRQKLLMNQRDIFINEIKQVIMNNGSIDDKAKTFILNITPPKVPEADKLSDFGGIYNSNKRTEKFWFFNVENIDRDKFIKDAEEELTSISLSLADDFQKDYRDNLERILSAVKAEFVQNLDKYSVLMKAKLADKEAMEQLRAKILDAASDLKNCQEELGAIMWRAKNDEQ